MTPGKNMRLGMALAGALAILPVSARATWTIYWVCNGSSDNCGVVTGTGNAGNYVDQPTCETAKAGAACQMICSPACGNCWVTGGTLTCVTGTSNSGSMSYEKPPGSGKTDQQGFTGFSNWPMSAWGMNPMTEGGFFGGLHEFQLVNPFAWEEGRSWFLTHYESDFSEWVAESQARWQAYLARNREIKEENREKYGKDETYPSSAFGELDGGGATGTQVLYEENHIRDSMVLTDQERKENIQSLAKWVADENARLKALWTDLQPKLNSTDPAVSGPARELLNREMAAVRKVREEEVGILQDTLAYNMAKDGKSPQEIAKASAQVAGFINNFNGPSGGNDDPKVLADMYNSHMNIGTDEYAQLSGASQASGTGAKLTNSGAQYNNMDCGIFALSNSTETPYGATSAVVLEKVRGSVNRPDSETGNPSSVAESSGSGLNVNELILASQSLGGETRVVSRDSIGQTVQETGKPVLVRIQNGEGGHFVAVTNVFTNPADGKKYYEVMDSIAGQQCASCRNAKTYWKKEDLDKLITSGGMVVLPPKGTVVKLLRGPDAGK